MQNTYLIKDLKRENKKNFYNSSQDKKKLKVNIKKIVEWHGSINTTTCKIDSKWDFAV